ncbi:MAG: putative selenium-dependent hydroxylase accessory protein YqeC [Desulfobacterales bacterium]|nr:putative selenium-dependent hydroxylase accessory protein YqeC [Desulfobacterales bacterium]
MRRTQNKYIDVLHLNGSGVISIVGSGGKTTLMYRLAHELSEAGNTVLTTTTTKIFLPTHEQSQDIIISYDVDDVIRQTRIMLHKTSHITAANDFDPGKNKLIGFDSGTVDKLWQSGLFQWIIVEADGSAQKPLKAPADHEPVIPDPTTHLIAVAGLDGVGMPLEEKWVFRPHLFTALTGLQQGETVTPESISTVMLHEKGVMKGCPGRAKKIVLLNKADCQDGLEKGKQVVTVLKAQKGIELSHILIGCACNEKSNIEIF